MSIIRITLVLLVTLFGSLAYSGTDGIYQLEGGYYSINVRFSPGIITVVEPNKTSEYEQKKRHK